MSRLSDAIPLLLIAALAFLVACAPQQTTTGRAPPQPGAGPADGASVPANVPAGTTRSGRVKTWVLPLGFVPYDNMTLPVVSPDGRFVATQAGLAPTWDTLLADGAAVPRDTRIEIYEVGAAQGEPPQLRHVLSEPLLLGRACDRRGFLVESPREDGARWIGRVAWDTQRVDWLVDDDAVNAFATLGPDGQLAWSRRAPGADRFSLLVRNGDREWTVSARGNDWLFPTFSGRGDGLFVLSLADGFLDAVFARAEDPATFLRTTRRLSIMQRAARLAAYQTLAGSTATIGGDPPPCDQFVFFHLPESCTAVWRPLASPTLTLLDPRSFRYGGGAPDFSDYVQTRAYAALPIDADRFLSSTRKALLLHTLTNPADRSELLTGLLIPRPTPRSEWPFMLLETDEGRIALTSMRLLPADDTVQ